MTERRARATERRVEATERRARATEIRVKVTEINPSDGHSSRNLILSTLASLLINATILSIRFNKKIGGIRVKSTVPHLQKGDTVGLVALSSPVKPEKLGDTIAFLDELGLNYIIGDTIQAKHDYLAGSDDERLADFHEMVRNPEVKAIFVLRGLWLCTNC